MGDQNHENDGPFFEYCFYNSNKFGIKYFEGVVESISMSSL